jgi:Ca-activated chloride channel family protein
MTWPISFGMAAGTALLLLVGLGLWLFSRRRRRVVEVFGDPPLLARLIGTDLRQPAWGRIVLVLSGTVALALALADLRWGTGDTAGLVDSGPVILVIDVSNSMLVEDANPSRLAWARAAAAHLVRELGDAPIGIVVFAGRAYALTPPTRDAAAVDLYLDALDTRMITQTGTALAGALRQSVGLLLAGEGEGGAMVVISDGNSAEDPDDLEEAIALTRRANVPVFVLGVGTAAGGPVPDLDPLTGGLLGFKREASGEVIESHLAEDLLIAVARGTGGAYFAAGENAPQRVADLVRARPGGGSGQDSEGPPRFAWFAAVALVLLAAEGAAGGRVRDEG